MPGILLVDKAAGWTSFDVVNKIRFQVAKAEGKKPKSVKVGHCGTLDPFATGLLVILVGKENTRKAEQYSKLDKTYEVTMKLGETSTTGDPEGEITTVSDRKPKIEEIEAALNQFVGDIQQTPPAFSAIKVNGQRAYKLAREGKEVVLEPRKITINRLELVDYNYPEVKFTADVSSGTYIRSLVEDIGKALQTGAYTSALRRTKIGDFSIKDAKSVAQLTAVL
ncbi:MAG TPA: tRNA pseudouridine(55) synthase TruB [Candidatus Saccharimonadales bacterium]|nr:tRNA pseudouridine(55) synthase TruB [Candidatus Saccharimonadales bacterium]